MVEIIGFIISLLALLYLFVQNKNPVQQKSRSSGYQREDGIDHSFKGFLKSIEKKAATREAVQHMPPTPPSSMKKKERSQKTPPRLLEESRQASSIEDHHLKSSLEDRHMDSRFNHEDLTRSTFALSLRYRDEGNGKKSVSRAQSAIRRLVHRRDMIIYQEILKKPKAF
jgi:hypothetical protein